MMKEYISFEYTNKEKFEKASGIIKIGNYIEIFSNRGITYGKLLEINSKGVTIVLENNEVKIGWEYIDSITRIVV